MISYLFDFSRFFLELLAGAYCFLCGMERKRGHRLHFCTVVVAGAALCVLFAALAARYGMRGIASAAVYTPLSLLPLLMAFLCFEGTAWNRVFCHISSITFRMCVARLVDVMEVVWSYFIGGGAPVAKGEPLRYAVYYPIFLLGCFLAAKFFSHIFRKGSDLAIARGTLFAYAIVFILTYVLSGVKLTLREVDLRSYDLLILCEFALYALVFYLQYSFFQTAQAEAESRVTTELWRKDRRQYEQAKENIEIINIKCHDLRHQLQAARESGTLDEGYLKEVEKSISIYDSAVKTGNETLDVILTDKQLRCEASGIQLTCMVDGQLLDMIERSDLISLFGNLLENALEYEVTVDDPEKRFISLTVRQAGQLLSIHVENYFEGTLTFENGLPVTVKEDKESHGYGIKSICRIVKKYGGFTELTTEDGMFQVNILIPFRQS